MRILIFEDHKKDFEVIKKTINENFKNLIIFPLEDNDFLEIRKNFSKIFSGNNKIRDDATIFFKNLNISESDCIILDYKLGSNRGTNGLSIYEELKLNNKTILMTRYHGVDFVNIENKIKSNLNFKNIIPIQKGNILKLNYEQKNLYLETIKKHFFDNINKSNNNKALKLFISYSKVDDDYKNEFIEHLATLRDEGKIEDFNDKQIELGSNPNNVIDKKLNECDYMVALVSVSFLNTKYIRDFEIDKAESIGKKIIPIIIKPCDWEDSKVGKYHASLKGANLSLKNNLLTKEEKEATKIERDAMWTKVIKEFREKLLN